MDRISRGCLSRGIHISAEEFYGTEKLTWSSQNTVTEELMQISQKKFLCTGFNKGILERNIYAEIKSGLLGIKFPAQRNSRGRVRRTFLLRGPTMAILEENFYTEDLMWAS